MLGTLLGGRALIALVFGLVVAGLGLGPARSEAHGRVGVSFQIGSCRPRGYAYYPRYRTYRPYYSPHHVVLRRVWRPGRWVWHPRACHYRWVPGYYVRVRY